MEAMASYLKNVHSPLYDRRLAILILKKHSYGRRSFSENARLTKIKDERRDRHYEPERQTYKTIQTNKENQEGIFLG
jgi:hypothetical protein